MTKVAENVKSLPRVGGFGSMRKLLMYNPGTIVAAGVVSATGVLVKLGTGVVVGAIDDTELDATLDDAALEADD